MMDWNHILRTTGNEFKKRAAGILTGIGVTGALSATVMAVVATPEAMRLIELKKQELNKDELTIMETVKAAGVCYIPTVVTSVISTACIIGAGSVNMKKNAALATAYQLSETALKTYREKVIETIGEKKEQQVQDAVAKDQIDRHPVGARTVLVTGKGNSLCYDVTSGRYFESDIETLRRVENAVNKQLLSQDYMSLNEMYDMLNLSPISIGEDIGWNVRKDFLEFEFSSQLTEDGRPCLVISYVCTPEFSYL